VVLVDFSLLEVGRVAIAKTTNICTQDYSMYYICSLRQLVQRSEFLSERKQRKSLCSVSPENIFYLFCFVAVESIVTGYCSRQRLIILFYCPTNAIYMSCTESFRTLKIARHCVHLAGRGKCYSLVMSLTNCVAKTALPYLA